MATGKIDEILSSLQKGDENFKIGRSRDVVLVLGEADADKSSLTRLIVGDDQNLVSRGLRFGNDWAFRVEESFTRSSETSFVPKLVVDEDGQEFYDCPGFADDADEAEDIAGAYFVRKVVARAESAKVVLVVKYDSVKDPSAIQNLLSKASKFVKDLDKFKDSVGIVVTRVDASVSNKSIRQSLSSIRRRLAGKTAEAKLLSILLSPGKIAVWRKPEVAGRAKDIPSLQQAKPSLQKLVHEELHFAICTPNDFGIVLSANSQRYLPGLSKKINDKIIADVAKIGDQLIGFYENLDNTSTDVDGLNTRFSMDYDKYYSKYSWDWNNAKDAKQLARKVLEFLQDMGVTISKDNLLSMLNSDLYQAFVEAALGRPTDRQLDWSSGFGKFANYMKDSYIWYQNLFNLQNVALSSYKIQWLVELIRPAADELSTTIANKGNFPASFKRFLEAIDQNEGIIDMVLGLSVNEGKKALLKTVVDASFNNDWKRKCEGKKLTITGQFVRTSDVKYCQDWSEAERKCCENPSEVEVFATHKVFFDDDIDWTGQEIQATIIAPTWEVIGERKISLDGKAGAGPGSKAGAQSARAGSPGKPGKPGLPGGPAGGLVAIGDRCVNCGQLNISLVGGRGGDGQDGGDGIKGEDGAKTLDPYEDGVYSSMEDLWKNAGHNACNSCNDCDGCYRCETVHRLNGASTKSCQVKGLPGKVGGRGGDGGQGGIGGPKGKIVARFTMEGFPNIKDEAGARGTNGIGGTGGEGGVKAEDMKMQVSYYAGATGSKGEYDDTKPQIKAESGAKGTDGLNNVDTITPTSLEFINPSLVLNDYKAFVRSNLNQSLKNAHHFLEKLGTDQQVLDLYNTLGLVKDMQSLEEQFPSLQNQIQFLPYYTNIQERIGKYGDKLAKTKENDDDHKMVLSYLYSAVLTKLRNINFKLNEGLVVNIAGHLKTVRKDIEKLKQAQEAVNKNKSKQVYLQGLQDKVEEANNFISGVIEPEIRNTISKTDAQIDSLIDETLKLKEDAKKERDKLIIRKHSLEDQMVLRFLLGTVQVASQFLALAGPVGATAGAVIGGVTQVAEGLALTDDDGNYELKKIPEGVEKSFTAISDHFKSKKESFKKQLEDSKGLLDKLDAEALKNSSIKKVNNKIESIQSKLKVEMDKAHEFDPESIDRMYTMRNELTDLLEEQKVQLEQAGNKADKKIDYIGKVKTLIEGVKVGKEVYDKIQKSQGAIDKLGETIKKANVNIAKLEQQEQNIYKIMMPMVNTMRKTLHDLRDEGGSKSHAALDVSKWQIQSSIQDLSKKLKEMTKGYAAQGELTYLMDKVEHGMTTTIQVYDRIQDYQDKAEVADYLSQISLTSNTVGNINDPDLKSAVDFLEMNTHFNLVLAEYEKTIDSLKHSVFPLAGRFLKSPDPVVSKFHFQKTEKLVENAVNEMAKELDGYIGLLERAENQLLEAFPGANIIPDKPYMSALGSVPFYTWKFTGREEIVQKLLDGREIILTADIADKQVENLNRYAIKFNQIGIDLQLSDRAAQAELDQVLEGFSVNMTHMGHSDYTCGEKSYSILHNPETLEHSVKKRVKDAENAEYYQGTANQWYLMLRKNDPLLSPYTTWKINLIADPDKKGDFAQLAKFKGRPIDLELEGRGQHIKPNGQLCDDLYEFYHEAKTATKEVSTEIRQDVSLWEMLGKPDGNAKKSSRSIDEPAGDTVDPSFFSGALDSISQVAKYLVPTQWFTSNQPENHSSSLLPGNVQIHELGSDSVAYKNSAVDTGMLNFQNNLLLLGLLGPKASKSRARRSADLTGDADRSFAHDMAYRAYAPKK